MTYSWLAEEILILQYLKNNLPYDYKFKVNDYNIQMTSDYIISEAYINILFVLIIANQKYIKPGPTSSLVEILVIGLLICRVIDLLNKLLLLYRISWNVFIHTIAYFSS